MYSRIKQSGRSIFQSQQYAQLHNLIYESVQSNISLDNINLPLQSLSLYSPYSLNFKVNVNYLSTTIQELLIQNYKVIGSDSLKNLSKLVRLQLIGTQITDFGFIQHLNLTELTVQKTEFTIFEKKIKNNQLSLRKLNLNKCSFNEIHLLQELTLLTELELSGNQLVNEHFRNCEFRLLQEIDVSHNKLRSLDNINTLSPMLVKIKANNNKMARIFFQTQQNSDLVDLDISHNKLKDISGLKAFINLQQLNIKRNLIEERRMKVIKNLPLQWIDLTKSQCISLKSINELTIQQIIFYDCQNCQNIFSCKNLKKYVSNYGRLLGNQYTHLQIERSNTEIILQIKQVFIQIF
ncbi:Conserved_hypothetical protein [Hexamita inflata]|uniref:Uncharacterized protein n=1 Tax=Hexamita inflata TaxID=28002 RepID=A0AA86TWW1_9EUKA|nr:Conserved hypothetical protein [Hexamita inflata]